MPCVSRLGLLPLALCACGSSAAGAPPASTSSSAGDAGAAPSPDCGILERQVSLDTGTGILYGTSSSPQNCPSRASALIIAGSGPTDRDGNSLPTLNTDSYRLMAEHLAGIGVTSLRYDKRGVGKSVAAAPGEMDLRFEMYVEDSRSWIRWLMSSQSTLPIVLLGHSEGALIATLAAETERVLSVASLEGAGRPGADILRAQLSAQLSAADYAVASSILDQLSAGQTVASVPSNLGSIFRPSVQPYLISWFAYDPATELAKLTVPTLIVQGTADVQTTQTDANLLANHASHGTLAVIAGMAHPLKLADPSDPRQTRAYTDPTVPLAPELLTALDEFIHAR